LLEARDGHGRPLHRAEPEGHRLRRKSVAEVPAPTHAVTSARVSHQGKGQQGQQGQPGWRSLEEVREREPPHAPVEPEGEADGGDRVGAGEGEGTAVLLL